MDPAASLGEPQADVASGSAAEPKRSKTAILGVGLAVFVVYYLSGFVGLALPTIHESATPVWAPTGIAIASLVLFGRRLWPAIAAGALLVNLNTSGHLASSLAIAFGNTAEGLLGAWVTMRFAGGRKAFERPEQVVGFAVLAAGLAPMASATVGVTSLVASGLASAGSFGAVWLTWWLGDAAGAIIVTPLVLLWARKPSLEAYRGRRAEAVFMGAATLALALAIFTTRLPLSFLTIPVVIWAAMRFGPRETVGAAFLLNTVAIVGTLQGRGPFQFGDFNTALLALQGFVAITTLTGLILATGVLQQRLAAVALKRGSDELERRVSDRTVQLQASEARLKEAQALSRVGSFDWDTASNRVTWSDELYRIYGLHPQGFAATFEAYIAHVHPEHRRQVQAAVEKALADRQAFEHDYRIVRADGQERWVHARGEPVLQAGKVVGLRGYCQDITGRKSAEERFQRIIESGPDAFVIVDAKGIMVEVNRQAETLFGYTPEEMVGRPIELLIPDSVKDRHVGYRESYVKDPQPRPMGAGLELKALRKDGTEVPVEISLSPVQTPDGLIVISAIRDVTERKRAQSERAELERLRAMDQFKAQFINMAAHELNTPLTPIKLQAHLLRSGASGPLTDQQRRSMEILERSVDRVALLVQNMLDVGRIQSGRIELKKGPLDVNAAVQEAVDAFQEIARQAGVHLEGWTQGDLWVEADAARVSQVLFNLVSNALKFTPGGGRVIVEVRHEGREASVVVRDTGAGLTSEQMARLFQPFTQVHDRAQTASRPGTGLGLYISKQLAELHGGTLTVSSLGPGQGSDFTFTLPGLLLPAGPASPRAPAGLRAPEPPAVPAAPPSPVEKPSTHP
ncbi:MAG: MASE1 domain-containing protein [Euryarchaeota archaeon]|nr:MASE1 domain-containing protein [Euryarchaeota archaeon]